MKNPLGIGAAVALALGSVCCVHLPSSSGGEASSQEQSLLYVIPQDGNTYKIVPIRTNGQAPTADGALALVGSRLTLYGRGAPTAPVRVAAVEQDDGLGCTDIDRITLDHNGSPRIREASFIGTFSPNPDRHYTQRTANSQERDELLTVAAREIQAKHSGQPQAYSRLLRNTHESADTSQDRFTIITDNVSGHRFAVLSLSATQTLGANSATISQVMRTGFFGVFESTIPSSWQARFTRAHSGCDDCEARPESFRLIAYGDFNQDGKLDFLLNREVYESWDYIVLWNSTADWEMESLAGGGC